MIQLPNRAGRDAKGRLSAHTIVRDRLPWEGGGSRLEQNTVDMLMGTGQVGDINLLQTLGNGGLHGLCLRGGLADSRLQRGEVNRRHSRAVLRRRRAEGLQW